MHVRFLILVGLLVFLAVPMLATRAAAGETVPGAVDVPRVLPDGAIDTSSMEGILKGLIKPGMGEQQKTLAIYHWFRRLVFHFRNMGSDRRNVLRVVNSYGYNLCGSQAGCLLVIFKAAGIKARPVAADAGPGYGGHTFLEAYYGGKWHTFDTMTNFCVMNREEKPSIASLEELKADPTLVTKAEEEKRTVGGFLTCRHKPALHYRNLDIVRKMGWKRDLRWATLAFGTGGKPGDLITFWTEGPKKWKAIGKEGSTYGGHYRPGLLDIKLKVNERWVMLWSDLGKWTVVPSYPGKGPFHVCGHCDEKDEVNFKYFEPYARTGLSPTKVCYRYYANGYLEWTPKSAAEVKAATRETGGTLVIPVKSPGPPVSIELDLELAQTGADAKTTVFLKYARKPKEVWSKSGPAKGLQKIVIPYQATNRPFCEFELHITGAGAAAVKRVKTIYQLNMYALPSLRPGKNTVRVSAKTKKPAGSKLVVHYEWNDGDDWKDARKVTKEFTTLPGKFEVEVAGKKMPRMRKLELRVEPVKK